jgi:DNA-binding NarL/FixJ family response regulator
VHGAFAIVEDEPDMRLLIRLALTRDGRLEPVGEASSAAEAFDLLSTASPELIVLDHSIEGDVTGLEAAPMLKQRADGAKILLFTAHDMAREAAAEPAIDGYLRKDRIDQLLVTVQEMLGLDAGAR